MCRRRRTAGPAGSSRPIRDAAADNAVLIGAGSRTHSDIPPSPGPGSQSGRCRSSRDSRNARRARRISRRSGSSSSRCARSLAAASCSSIAVPMSMEGRIAAMVAMVLRSARIQPMRSPPQNDFDIDPTVSTRSRRVVMSAASGAGTGWSSHMSLMVSSMIGAGPGLGDDVRQPLSVRSGHGVAGRVVVVGNQVGQIRGQLMDRGLHRVEIPAVLGHRDGHRTRPRGGDRRQRTVIRGLLDQHPVARLHVRRQDQADGMQRAGGHHDLVGLGGKSSLAISFGNRLPQCDRRRPARGPCSADRA